jgi:hypothetical protein
MHGTSNFVPFSRFGDQELHEAIQEMLALTSQPEESMSTFPIPSLIVAEAHVVSIPVSQFKTTNLSWGQAF